MNTNGSTTNSNDVAKAAGEALPWIRTASWRNSRRQPAPDRNRERLQRLRDSDFRLPGNQTSMDGDHNGAFTANRC